MIYYSVRTAGLLPELPEHVRDELLKLYRNATFHALVVQRDLIRVHKELDAAGIPHLFLKGAFLANFAYPELGLRPLRDIDVLVPKGSALFAYHRLEETGFQPFKGLGGHLEAIAQKSKHLPPLRAPDGGTSIEIHSFLTCASEFGFNARMPDFSLLMDRSISRIVADEVIDFPSVEDTLLHLCTHAVYDHQFSNGPLVLSDLFWMIQTQPLDWDRLWQTAHENNADRGLMLTLRLLAAHAPETKPQGLPGMRLSNDLDPEVLRDASALLLRDFDARGDVGLVEQIGRSGTAWGGLRELMRRMFPSRIDMARKFPLAPQSPIIFTFYPIFWVRFLWQRAPSILITLCSQGRGAERRALQNLNSWLLK